MVAGSRRFLRHLLPTYGVPSITALCQRLGLTKQYAWMLWHGKIGLSTAMLRRLHDELGIPLEELLRVERATPAKAAGRKPRRQRLKARRPVTAAKTPASTPAVEAEAPAPIMLTPQARKAALVARLQAMKAEGLTLQAIATQLNAEGVPTISGRGRWQAGIIANVLREYPRRRGQRMKRRYERTVSGGWVAVLIPETQEDQAEIDAMEMRGEVNDYASFGDRREEVAAAAPRLSRLQRRILAWLVPEEQRLRGTMAASHEDLVRAMVARGHDKGNVSTSLKGLEAKGLITITRTPGGRAEAVDLTREGRNRVAALTASCE